MNINFDEIITKANARKDALLAVQSSLSESEHRLGQLDELTAWAAQLSTRILALDTEGRQLLGEPGVSAVLQLTTFIKAVKYGMTHNDVPSYGNGHKGNSKPFIVNLNMLLGK